MKLPPRSSKAWATTPAGSPATKRLSGSVGAATGPTCPVRSPNVRPSVSRESPALASVGRGDVAKHDPRALAVDGCAVRALDGAVCGAQGDVEHGIERSQQLGIEGQPCRVHRRVVHQACAARVHAIRCADLGTVRRFRVHQPAVGRHVRGGGVALADVPPERIEIRGAREDAAETDDGDVEGKTHAGRIL